MRFDKERTPARTWTTHYLYKEPSNVLSRSFFELHDAVSLDHNLSSSIFEHSTGHSSQSNSKSALRGTNESM
jgi:hypothetical protein